MNRDEIANPKKSKIRSKPAEKYKKRTEKAEIECHDEKTDTSDKETS